MNIGDAAPEFTLKDQNDKDVKLSDFKGKKVLLSFHPLLWTGICNDQMNSLEDNFKAFEALNTVALGISVDTQPTKAAWATENGIENTKLLSDFWPHGATAKKYSVFIEEKGIAQRANLIVDESGKIKWIKTYPIPQLPDIDEVLEALK